MSPILPAPVLRRVVAATLPLALLIAAPARAQDACADPITQFELNQCAQADWRSADKELNRAYEAALARARDFDSGWDEGRAEETLRAAQRAWIPFRDAACEAEAATWDGGTGQAMIYYGCLARVTGQRADDLWAYAGQ